MTTGPSGGPDGEEKEMPLLGHLDELRTRLIICVGFFIAAVVGSFAMADRVLAVIIDPVKKKNELFGVAIAAPPPALRLTISPDGSLRAEGFERLRTAAKVESLDVVLLPAEAGATSKTLSVLAKPDLIYTHPLDPITIQFKIALVLGILLSLVVWVWQIWAFVAPGLTPTEKRVVKPMLAGAILLFPLGSVFAYFMVYMIVALMRTYAAPGIENLYTITAYVKLMTTMMIVFGIIFELPLVVALMARAGVVTPAFLRRNRKHIYVGLAVAAMILTPTTDPFSMTAAWLPLVLLFELSIWVAGPMALMRARAMAEDEDDGFPP